MQFTTQLPAYYLLLCVALAGGFTWLLYRTHPFTEQTKRPWWLWFITAFRFLTLFILSALLLEPLLKAFQRHVEKPVIAIVLDGSESITANKDSTVYSQTLVPGLQALGERLSQEYDVVYFTMGQSLREGLSSSFSEKQTNIGAAVDELYNRFDKQNLGGVILATDGIYNSGVNPLALLPKLKAPVLTIALGDTNLQKDIRITNVRHNQLAYLGNSFPLVIESECVFARGQKIELLIMHQGKTVFKQTLQPDADRKFFSTPVSFEATTAGMQHYIVQLSRISNEISYVNNRYDVFIEVLDARQKILLIAQSPHPDVGAIRSALENNPHYEVTTVLADDAASIATAPYSLAILHQLPGVPSFQPVFDRLINQRIPMLFIAGTQMNYNRMSQYPVGFNLTGFRGLFNDAGASVNPGFGLFTTDEAFISNMSAFPPLKAPFGNYVAAGEHDIWLKQQIGNVITDMPLISFHKNNDVRTATIWGEGIWRWRLTDYQLHNNHEVFDGLWSKLAQYLSVKDDKRSFRVNTVKRTFSENEHVTFEAELYNKSYELINEPDVQLSLTNSEGKSFNYAFSRSDKSYRLDAGVLPAGTYRWSAFAQNGSQSGKVSGSFTVTPLVTELLNTRANHALLQDMAEASKGRMFYPAEISQAEVFIRQSETIKPIVYRQEEVMDLIHLKGVFILLLILLSTEWAVRKYNGSY